MIDYECEKKHEGKMMLRQYTNIYNKYCILKEKCKDCERKVKGDLLYCFKWYKFIFYSYRKNHLIEMNIISENY